MHKAELKITKSNTFFTGRPLKHRYQDDDDGDAVAVVAAEPLLPLTEQVKREITTYKNLDKLIMTSNPLVLEKS